MHLYTSLNTYTTSRGIKVISSKLCLRTNFMEFETVQGNSVLLLVMLPALLETSGRCLWILLASCGVGTMTIPSLPTSIHVKDQWLSTSKDVPNGPHSGLATKESDIFIRGTWEVFSEPASIHGLWGTCLDLM